MIGFLSRLFGFDSDSPESSDAVVSACSSCGFALVDCRCCYICGAAERTTCACSSARSDAALQELVDELDSQPGGQS